ncbi:MAG: chromosomal replication initiator protein DnaA, partial [Nitrospiraceae bacterium]|nr:chromosomal replication initiator protein DnaA [Nitrospiraceae bacterium]
MESGNVWDKALAHIESRVPKQIFETWFMPTRLREIEGSTARVEVPNKFFGQWLTEHHEALLSEALAAAQGGHKLRVLFVIADKTTMKAAEGRAATARVIPANRLRRVSPMN